jgi:hypothetical protein
VEVVFFSRKLNSNLKLFGTNKVCGASPRACGSADGAFWADVAKSVSCLRTRARLCFEYTAHFIQSVSRRNALKYTAHFVQSVSRCALVFALRAPNLRALSLNPAMMWAADARSSHGHRIMACINQVREPPSPIPAHSLQSANLSASSASAHLTVETRARPQVRAPSTYACMLTSLSRRYVRRDPGQAHLIHDHSTGRSSTRERDAFPPRAACSCLPPPSPCARGRSRCASGSACLRSEEDLILGCLARQTHTHTHIHTHKQIHSQASMHLQAATRPWAPPLDGTRLRCVFSCALAYGRRF